MDHSPRPLSRQGLRERKKARTRRALAAAALRLFAERGYEETTIADIAEAAEVSPRTFFAYFPSKEDVVFAEVDDRLAEVGELLAGRRANRRCARSGARWWRCWRRWSPRPASTARCR
ncbi:TetR family transcriptional regulator [Actinomadura namibiensis]|uniref:TetR family transcriptional regulator n=1 Tax=Actinomadura kijaniata TaxID=46161 RepID=UPI00360C3591